MLHTQQNHAATIYSTSTDPEPSKNTTGSLTSAWSACCWSAGPEQGPWLHYLLCCCGPSCAEQQIKAKAIKERDTVQSAESSEQMIPQKTSIKTPQPATYSSVISVCSACARTLAASAPMLLPPKLCGAANQTQMQRSLKDKRKSKNTAHSAKIIGANDPRHIQKHPNRTYSSSESVLLVRRACARAMAPSVPMLLQYKLRYQKKHNVYQSYICASKHCIHAHFSDVNVRLVCRVCPSALAPSSPMLMRVKLCGNNIVFITFN